MDLLKFPVLLLKFMPKQLIKPIAFKYVAGECIDDSIKKVRELNRAGIMATIDILGEAALTEDAVNSYVNQYILLINQIGREGLKSGISIKPTAMGLSISKDMALRKIRELVSVAKPKNVFIRIDMEDSPYTSQTLELYKILKAEYDRIGVVLQAYLKRTENDIKDISNKDSDVRLCKGIYRESFEISLKGHKKINDNFILCLEDMLKAGFKVAIATHDYSLIDRGVKIIKRNNIPKSQFEFQMLYGVRYRKAASLAKDGYNVRIYVPFGKDWYPYSMRRMYENPLIAFHVTKALFVDSFYYMTSRIYKYCFAKLF